jgi:hypothetical protein
MLDTNPVYLQTSKPARRQAGSHEHADLFGNTKSEMKLSKRFEASGGFLNVIV